MTDKELVDRYLARLKELRVTAPNPEVFDTELSYACTLLELIEQKEATLQRSPPSADWTPTVDFDRAKVDKLQADYNRAVAARLDKFVFEGHELVTRYAFYMLQHLNEVVPPAAETGRLR